MEHLLIAYSGGIDSTLLSVLAQEALPGKVRCVLLDAPIVPRRGIDDAVGNAHQLGLSCEVMPFPVMENEVFRKNNPDRCYICKKLSAGMLRNRAEKLGISNIADGINASDLNEYRPGLKAGSEEGIIHPFLLSGVRKAEIRQMAQDCGLDIWNKPSSSCLASRIPYGEEITTEKLQMIEKAEDFMQDLGFSQLRVRMHGKIARIELLPGEFERAIGIRQKVVDVLESFGFSYVTLDLKGYRSGSMDEVL